MASQTSLILVALLVFMVVAPMPGAAAAPTYGSVVLLDYADQPYLAARLTDTTEVRFALSTQNVPQNHSLVVDLFSGARGDVYSSVPLVRADAAGLYRSGYSAYFSTAVREDDSQRYRWRDITSGDYGPWQFCTITPIAYKAPQISEPLVSLYGTEGQMVVRVNITWISPGYEYTIRWIPRSGEIFSRGFSAAGARGTHEYDLLSGTVRYGTPGWVSVSAISENGAETVLTRPYISPAPTAPPSPIPTTVPTTVPTTISPTGIPTEIPTGILTYPTPLPTIAPTPELTPVPVGTLAYQGIPRWSSGFRLEARPLPTLPVPASEPGLHAAPQPLPVYIDVPQWTNFSVPTWLRNPVPVVGPASDAISFLDSWIDAFYAIVFAPVEAIVTPFVVWIAHLAAGLGDAIGALGTWLSGIAVYARGFGDCYWVLIPLPVWVAAAIAVWWRLLHVVLAFLSSEQYTWLFEVKH